MPLQIHGNRKKNRNTEEYQAIFYYFNVHKDVDIFSLSSVSKHGRSKWEASCPLGGR